MKKGNTSKYISSAIYVLFGIILIAFPGLVGETLCYMLGGAAIAAGLIYIVSYIIMGMESKIAYGDNGIATGILLVIIGLFVILKLDLLIEIIPLAMGLMIVVKGVFGIQSAMDMLKLGYGNFKVNIVVSAVVAVFGVVMMLDPFSTARILFIFIGVGLLVSAIVDVAAAIMVSRGIKKAEATE